MSPRWLEDDRKPTSTVIATFALLIIRGIALWLLVPFGTVMWLFTAPWKSLSLDQFLGWIDHNMIYVLQKRVLLFGFRDSPIEWVPRTRIATVTHRVRL